MSSRHLLCCLQNSWWKNILLLVILWLLIWHTDTQHYNLQHKGTQHEVFIGDNEHKWHSTYLFYRAANIFSIFKAANFTPVSARRSTVLILLPLQQGFPGAVHLPKLAQRTHGCQWRRDIQLNDTHHNNSLHIVIEYNGIQHNSFQQTDKNSTISTTTLDAECRN